MTPIELVLSKLREHGRDPKPSGDDWSARCPAPNHEDKNASLSLSEADDGRVLLKCHSRDCPIGEICEGLGIEPKDLFPSTHNPQSRNGNGTNKPKTKYNTADEAITAVTWVMRRDGFEFAQKWPYYNAAGEDFGWVNRYDKPTSNGEKPDKEFRPVTRHADGWQCGDPPQGILWPLYLVQDLVPADLVIVTEGEKTVDATKSIGLVGCTSAYGSKSPHKTDWTPLSGKTICIIADNDDVGRRYAQKVAVILLDLGCRVKIIELPDLPPTGDVVDWMDHLDSKEPADLKQAILDYFDDAEWLSRSDFETRADPPKPSEAPFGSSGSPDPWGVPDFLPDELPKVMPFDSGLLPKSLRPFVCDISERIQCPIDYPAIAAMTTLSTIIGRKIGIRPKRYDDWQVVSNLWAIIIGRPGVMKSPALMEVVNILKRFEIEAKERFDTQAKEHEAAEIVAKANREVQQASIKAALKNGTDALSIAASMLDAELEPPQRQRFIVNDSTVEKLGVLLNENPNGMLIFRDEIVGFLKTLDKQGQEAARAFYLEAWNGNGRYTYDRIGRGTLDIDAAIVSILGGGQPGMLAGYLSQAVKGGSGDDGLMQRFQLAVWPDSTAVWKNVDRWPSSTAKQQAESTFRRLAELDARLIGAEDSIVDSMPYLRFSEAAQEDFNDWRGILEQRLRTGNEHPAMESHLAKYRSLIPSLSLLIHLADKPSGGPVGQEPLTQAIAWGKYLESHARRLYGTSINAELIAAHALAKKILDGTLQDGFTLKSVYRNGWSNLGSREDASEAANYLIDLNWLQTETIPTDGRDKTIYHINPKKLSHPAKDEPPKLPKAPSGGSGSSVSGV